MQEYFWQINLSIKCKNNTSLIVVDADVLKLFDTHPLRHHRRFAKQTNKKTKQNKNKSETKTKTKNKNKKQKQKTKTKTKTKQNKKKTNKNKQKLKTKQKKSNLLFSKCYSSHQQFLQHVRSHSFLRSSLWKRDSNSLLGVSLIRLPVFEI